jgi:hypothetical protein
MKVSRSTKSRIKTEEYRSPFKKWDEVSWIRAKPCRVGIMTGLPFTPEEVPIALHTEVFSDESKYEAALAYKLLSYLQFTTRLELCHVSPVCSMLSQDGSPIQLSSEQRLDALRIYCDEGGHALFVESLSDQVERYYGIDRCVLGMPMFDTNLSHIISDDKTNISEDIIRLCFVIVSETLVTNMLESIPRDNRVSPIVREVVKDHADDEVLHSVYFKGIFTSLWQQLSYEDKITISQLLPRLLSAFLKPDINVDLRILSDLGFDRERAREMLDEIGYTERAITTIKEAATPTIDMFDRNGVFSLPGSLSAFSAYSLV